MKKRLVSMFLCLAMVVGLFPVVAVAGTSDGYRIRTGSGLYAELSKLADTFGDTTENAVAAVEQWLKDKKSLNPADLKSEADKLSTPEEKARFGLDNLYISVILVESIFNYAAQIDKADLKYSGDSSSMGDVLMMLFGISEALSVSQQELIDPVIKMRGKIFEALEKMFPEKTQEAVEELRQMLRERAVYGGTNDTYERLRSCMKSACAIMGFDEDTTETMVDALDIWLADEDAKSIEAWQKRGKTNEIEINLNAEEAGFDEKTKIACAESIYVIIAEIMSFKGKMDWEKRKDMADAYKAFTQRMVPMLLEYMMRGTELMNEEKYLELTPLFEEMDAGLNEAFEIIFAKFEASAEKYQTMLQAGYEQIRAQAVQETQEDHSGVIAGLALIAADLLLTRAIRVTAAATALRAARTFAVPAILLTGAVRTLRRFTMPFIPFAFR